MKIYNTLTRKKETLKPIKPKTVTMYSCGPTVYNFAHIGNMRTYIFMDILRRSLKFCGFKIRGVMNITDVGHLLSDADEGEDKMALAARRQQKTPQEIADFYTQVFFEDCKKLNIGSPEVVPKATEHIAEMIAYVEGLIKGGYAYETDDGIYFDIAAFSSYGALSRLDLEEQIAGARVEVNSQKRHPADFALWKKAEPNHIMQWDSPWGRGYPGWHIECSAMAKKYFGKVFDIHTGGVDHIPIHHENEIAQSEALEGCKTVQYWMHGEFMLVDGGKMSKSLGNTYTVKDLQERGYSPLSFRYFCLNAHYRKKLNFTFEGLSAAQTALFRLYVQLFKHKSSAAKTDADVLARYKDEFISAVTDDLNIPLCLGILWTMLKEPFSADIYKTALEFDTILGLNLAEVREAQDETAAPIPDEVITLARQRQAAREAKLWAESDRLREEIAQLGYAVEDGKDGYKLKARN
ncbi:MAG: cysteine--tRNA ligase [Firmicutes bacterium]|nr:cysteine--tRNA ligase [Bacillota bacterium]